ncbi:DUF4233 domain-containing protein [Tsukamurella sp. 8F]|uniref:DUF4233 domain-containing protein n=1 Tax=unclassified Tsukamurella TaxID=2633480 RepID=UPI0023BA02A9|nr:MULTISPECIES: DUF4233 domain-containing protein [unclassified Tsukamurella]MDF0528746.1 DUF4233 domain-containing protein [Tsukamurella sp. 8J]MDF0586581.1 DUF4233 domain-containing protein [Tsukamurella sp. 8F]
MSSPTRFSPPAKDPWKSFRGIMSATLILELIVVLLALPVVFKLSNGLTAAKVAYVLVFAVVLFLGCMVVRRPWALTAFCLLQLVLIAGWFIHPGIGMVGVVFAVVWGYLFYLRRDVQKRMDAGRLPGQEPLD